MVASGSHLDQVSEGALLIVNYHYIRDPSAQKYPGIHPISHEAFRQQLEFLVSRFHAATPTEVEAFARGEVPFGAQPAMFVTFDDGLVDHLFAAELLSDMGLCGAFFVSSQPLIEHRPLVVHKVHWLRANTPPDHFRKEFLSLLGDATENVSLDADMRRAAAATYVYDVPADAELKYLMNFLLSTEVVDRVTEQMLVERGISDTAFCESLYVWRRDDWSSLSSAGHVVGCHGHSHVPFASLPADRLAGDINRCLACLGELTGKRSRWVSYPYGSPTAIPADPTSFCLRFGFDIGLTLNRGWNRQGQPAAALNRINTNEVDRFVG